MVSAGRLTIQARVGALRASLTQEPSGRWLAGASPRTSGRVRSLRCSDTAFAWTVIRQAPGLDQDSVARRRRTAGRMPPWR
jgi:hypothetical protein